MGLLLTIRFSFLKAPYGLLWYGLGLDWFSLFQGPEPELQKNLREELESRLVQLQQRVTTLRTESEEVWKTLETAETTLLEMLNAKDYDCSGYFGDTAVPASKPPETVSIKLRADRQETEEFYLTVSTRKLKKKKVS